MNLNDYTTTHKAKYHDLAKTVVAILTAALSTRDDIALPVLTKERAKSEESLRLKLEQRGLAISDAIEEQIKDLAGCRLVFNTNTDVETFLQSGIIFDNFDVDRTETKIHHPVSDERSANDEYRATHYLVSLKSERLSLPEYARFAGLRCEIQIQTLLNHAWSETAHDIIYKHPLPQGFGTRQLDAIKARMQAIMTKHLVPAGYEFQKVQHDFQRIKEGKDLLKRRPLDELAAAPDNNKRAELLKNLNEQVVPHYDDIRSVYPELRRAVIKALHDGRLTPLKPIETAFGNFPGRTSYDVTDAAIDILDDLRYVDIAATLSAYCDVFTGAADDRERKRILEAVEHLARHDLNAWKQVGPYVQSQLLGQIEALTVEQKQSLRPITLCVCKEALSSSVTGTSSPAFDTIAFDQGGVRVSDVLSKVRSTALGALETLYRDAHSEEDRRSAFHAMMEAGRQPSMGNYEDSLIVEIARNLTRVVSFCTDERLTMSYELMQHIEHELLWYYQYAPSWANNIPAAKEPIDALVVEIARFRDAINADPEFVMHKTLVGFESVFLPDWDNDGLDRSASGIYRAERMNEYVAQVSPSTADEWLRRIRRCASTRSDDLATFPTFFEFLRRLAIAQPDVIMAYASAIPSELVSFIPPIFAGLEASSRSGSVPPLVEQWIKDGKYLRQIARHFRLASVCDLRLLIALLRRALDLSDTIAVLECIVVVAVRPEFTASPAIDDVFVPGLAYLTQRNDTRWVDEAWFQKNRKLFFSSFDSTRAQLVLDNLVHRFEIDVHAEEIILALTQAEYEALWNFFGRRLAMEAQLKQDKKEYDAIPYKFYRLHAILAQDANRAVDVVKTWYADNDYMFEFAGGRLLAIAFPACPDQFRDKLVAVISAEGSAVFKFVQRILNNYRGNPRIHPICQALVDSLAEDDERLGNVEILLMGTDVMVGPFGSVEAYKKKKDEMASWVADPRPRVRAFAERYGKMLDLRIAGEQRSSEQRHELRKLDWQDDHAS